MTNFEIPVNLELMNPCKDCGAEWGDTIFLWISDELWKKIECDPKDFLCAHCIVDRLQAVTFAAYLVGGPGEHKIEAANSKITMEQKTQRVLASKGMISPS